LYLWWHLHSFVCTSKNTRALQREEGKAIPLETNKN
jgi:hypothetical protein